MTKLVVALLASVTLHASSPMVWAQGASSAADRASRADTLLRRYNTEELEKQEETRKKLRALQSSQPNAAQPPARSADPMRAPRQ